MSVKVLVLNLFERLFSMTLLVGEAWGVVGGPNAAGRGGGALQRHHSGERCGASQAARDHPPRGRARRRGPARTCTRLLISST